MYTDSLGCNLCCETLIIQELLGVFFQLDVKKKQQPYAAQDTDTFQPQVFRGLFLFVMLFPAAVYICWVDYILQLWININKCKNHCSALIQLPGVLFF